MTSLDLKFSQVSSLDSYESISIGAWQKERVDLPSVGIGPNPEFQTIQIEPFWKDYDEVLEDRPSAFRLRFDTSEWGFLLGTIRDKAICGAILAYRCNGFDLLEGRDDLVHIVDFRVHPDFRGHGLGQGLWAECVRWSSSRGAIELRVETQDVNVPACRFYSAMGCRLLSADPLGYGCDVDEAKLIWGLML